MAVSPAVAAGNLATVRLLPLAPPKGLERQSFIAMDPPKHDDHRIALHDLFPRYAQLQFGEAVADAAVDAEAEGEGAPTVNPSSSL
jgi:hypothetical protein